MAEKEISFYKNVYSEGCPSCNRIEPQPNGLDIVLETDNFRVHQDYALPIPGMMVIETKRHIANITEFSSEEIGEFFCVLTKIRESMKSAGIETATLVQEEKKSHFHIWWMPSYSWMEDITNGNVRNIQSIFDYCKDKMITRENIQEVEVFTKKIKDFLK